MVTKGPSTKNKISTWLSFFLLQGNREKLEESDDWKFTHKTPDNLAEPW